MADEKYSDDHVVCVPCQDPDWSELDDVDDLSAPLRAEISHFFSVYRDLDANRHAEAKGCAEREAAIRTIDDARERFGTSQRGDERPPR